jgi:hypothetical protein
MLGNMEGNLVVTLMLLISAAISIPMSSFVNRMGLRRSFGLSMLLVVIAVLGILFINNTLPTFFFILVFSIGFTGMSVSALPLVLHESSFSEKVFCVGIFYSAVALPDGIVETSITYLSSIGF